MELRRGKIRDELELKAFILFVLKHFTEPVSEYMLTDVTMDRVDWFYFAAALGELIESGLVGEPESKFYEITELGLRTLPEVEKELTASTRLHTSEDILRAKRRESRIIRTASAKTGENNEYKTTLVMDSGEGMMLWLEILMPDARRAENAEKTFRRAADEIYSRLVEDLGDGE